MKALLTAAAMLTMPAPVLGQPAKPSGEVQELGYYVGSWEGHGETKAGPFGEAGKLSSHMTCKWFAGGFHVLCEGEETGPTGTRKFLNILGYDEGSKAYTEYSISNLGESEYDRNGSLAGNKLTYLVDQDAGGKPAKFRYTETRMSPELMTYDAEVSLDGAPWALLAKGEIKKVK
ncbi:MAG TPA: DUF1579 family protein [Sphingomicrobium sp.]|jgi:hypothetical protein